MVQEFMNLSNNNLCNHRIFVISGQSGAGKTSIVQNIIEKNNIFYRCISSTTREKRINEVDGIDYNFISTKEFQDLEKKGEFLEFSEIYGNKYGVHKKQIQIAYEKNKYPIVVINGNGYITMKKMYPKSTIGIFILVPSKEFLYQRLKLRGENVSNIEHRMNCADDDLSYSNVYEHNVINDDFQTAVNEVEKIMLTAI